MTDQTSERLPFLDLLRAIAISLVLFCHFRELPGCPKWYEAVFFWGIVGVDIFFVLSGYLIGMQVFREIQATGKLRIGRFLVRRWLRTLPAYYAMLFVLLGVGLMQWGRMPEYVLFLQNYLRPAEWLQSWSLCVEEHFYLALPLLVNLLVKVPKRVTVAATVLLVALSPLLRMLNYSYVRELYDYGANPEYTLPAYLEYLLTAYPLSHLRFEGLAVGVVLAQQHTWNGALWRALASRPMTTGLFGVVVLVVGTWAGALNPETFDRRSQMEPFCVILQPVLVAIGTAALIAYGVRDRRHSVPGAHLVSEYAYTLYLTHMLGLKFTLALAMHRGMDFWISLPTALAFSWSFAFSLRGLIEEPSLKLRARLLAKRST